MSAQTILSGGDKYYSYSGEVVGDVSVPTTIPLIFIPNTGLRDSLIQIQPYFGKIVDPGFIESLGVQVKMDDVVVLSFNQFDGTNWGQEQLTQAVSINNYSLFLPRQSKLEIIRLNTTRNNTQTSGCNILGYYL